MNLSFWLFGGAVVWFIVWTLSIRSKTYDLEVKLKKYWLIDIVDGISGIALVVTGIMLLVDAVQIVLAMILAAFAR